MAQSRDLQGRPSPGERPMGPMKIETSVEKNELKFLLKTDVSCCKLNNTRDCDEHLFGQVSTPTAR